MLNSKEAERVCKEVLKRCGDHPAEVLLAGEDQALTRFANNAIHQNVSERNHTLILSLFIGRAKGVATTNRLDAAALDEVAANAEAIAKASPENPDDPGLVEPGEYAQVEGFDQPTAGYSPEKRAREVSVVCRQAAEKGLNASGAFSTGYWEMAFANSLGAFVHYASTRADFQTVVMDAGASGWAHASSWRASDIPVEDLGQEAMAKAERGRNPQKVTPGEYPVVFDPYVTQDLLLMLNFHGMGAQTVLEGRSWMNGLTGEKAMDAQVSIWDDGLDPSGLPTAFDVEGAPKQRVDIVSQGVVGGPVYDRITAEKAGVTNTGHAAPLDVRAFGYNQLAFNLMMAPGSISLEDMIRETEKGLYVTRFWYTRLVHPRDCVVTGMTRDGVFMIEKGELAYPVKNLRFTQSYVKALANVEVVGRETRLLHESFGGITTRVPALKISGFNFTGTTV